LRLLFVNCYFWPDFSATAQLLSDLTEFLAAVGHHVEVLASPHLYAAKAPARLPREEIHRGVLIHRLASPNTRGSKFAARWVAASLFNLAAARWIFHHTENWDAVITLTDPPLLGAACALPLLLSRRPVKRLCWVMDLCSDCLFALGVLRPTRPIGALLEAVSRFELRSAHAIVCLGPCMRDRLLLKGLPPHRLHVLGLWSRADQLHPLPPHLNPLRRELGLLDRCVVMYSGNAGRLHTFTALFHAMLELRHEPQLEFVFAGGGSRLPEVEAFVRRHRLLHFRRLDYAPRHLLNQSLGLGDIHVVCLAEGMTGIAVPSKLYGIMAIGRPTLYVGPPDSSVALQIQEAQAGYCFSPQDGPGLAQAIRSLAHDPAERSRLGMNGRSFFLAHHEMILCCRRWEELLRTLVSAA
jgi:colanic acid biosynthesis glycosyl transferase WcaI